MNHVLKISRPFLLDVVHGRKLFEVRRNDRGFKVGDYITLREFADGTYGEDQISALISYILPGGQFGIEEGFVVLGIRPHYHTSTIRGNTITVAEGR